VLRHLLLRPTGGRPASTPGTRSPRLAVKAVDVAARNQKVPLLGQQRNLISGEGAGNHLPQGWISPHLGQEPQ
jgi:hypothetical protein